MTTVRTIGPESGTLTLHTGVEGRMARMGHALTLLVGDWEAAVDVDGDLPVAVRLRAALPSLSVLAGEGGIKPLSDKDRTTIVGNALGALRADEHPYVLFASRAVRPADGGFELEGELSVAGVARPHTLRVQVVDAGERRQLVARTAVVQTEHGVKPYSAMAGGLKLRDRVDVQLDASVPA